MNITDPTPYCLWGCVSTPKCYRVTIPEEHLKVQWLHGSTQTHSDYNTNVIDYLDNHCLCVMIIRFSIKRFYVLIRSNPLVAIVNLGKFIHLHCTSSLSCVNEWIPGSRQLWIFPNESSVFIDCSITSRGRLLSREVETVFVRTNWPDSLGDY